MWPANFPINHRYQIVPKLIFLTFGLQYYMVYQFRGIFFINGFKLEKDLFGNVYGVFMLLIFIISLVITFLMDRYQLSKRNILITFVFFHMTTLIILFSTSGHPNISLIFFFFLLMSNYPQNSIIDKIMLDYLINRHSVSTYGNQKLYETIGFGISTYTQELYGNLGNINGDFKWKSLQILIIIFSVMFILSLFIFIDIHQQAVNSNIRARDIIKLLKNMKYFKFLLVSLLMGITRTGTSIYTTNFYMDYLGLKNQNILSELPNFIQNIFFLFKKTPVTIAVISCVIAEIIFLKNTQFLIKKYGVYTLILFGIIAQFFRILICLFIKPKSKFKFIAILIVEFLKGINFGVFQPAGVILAEQIAPPEYKMLSQLCFNGMYNGISFFISGLIFGWIFKNGFNFQAFKIFFILILGILSLNAVLVFIFYFLIERRLFVSRKYT